MIRTIKVRSLDDLEAILAILAVLGSEVWR